MATTKTESKAELLNRLFKENGLLKEDWHEHKHYRIITRSGIEKIQYQNNVTIRFEAVIMTPVLCVVKASATKKAENGDTILIETFGSAGHNANGEADKGKQFQYLYYPEMAEKRALSRAVLKICNFYELGVFGEDEAEDFKKEEPSKPSKGDGTPRVMPPVAIGPPEEGTDPDAKPISINQKTQILLLLNNSVIQKAEKEKVISNLDTFDALRADKAIIRLKKVILERTNAEATNSK